MRHDVRPAKNGGRIPISDRMREAARRCAEGEHAGKVARDLGVSQRTIWHWCHLVREARRDAAAEAAGRAVAAQ